MKQIDSKTYLVDTPEWPDFIHNRPDECSKTDFGHALLIAGSYGKMGAAILAAKACLRSGVGLLTVHVPRLGVAIMQTAVPEAMVSIDESDDHWTHSFTPTELKKYDALAIGPGIGTKSASTLRNLFDTAEGKPLVVDADGLNMLARMGDKLSLMKQHTQSAPLVLTPHAREFERLFGSFTTPEELIDVQRRISCSTGAIIVRKAHQTHTSSPDGCIYLNTTGNSGMATAGSGDVLTGIILAEITQNKDNQYDAAKCVALGVWIHGKSADFAIQKQSKCSLIASDIVKNLQYVTI